MLQVRWGPKIFTQPNLLLNAGFFGVPILWWAERERERGRASAGAQEARVRPLPHQSRRGRRPKMLVEPPPLSHAPSSSSSLSSPPSTSAHQPPLHYHLLSKPSSGLGCTRVKCVGDSCKPMPRVPNYAKMGSTVAIIRWPLASTMYLPIEWCVRCGCGGESEFLDNGLSAWMYSLGG